jgi:hypothetical protein
MDAQSIRIPGLGSFSYARIEPMATALTLMVDTLDVFRTSVLKTGKGSVDTSVMEALQGAFVQKTFMSGVADLMDLVGNPGRSTDEWNKKLLRFTIRAGTGYVPNIIKQGAKATSPEVRRSSGSRAMGFWNALATDTAIQTGMKRGPEVYDLYGRKVIKPFYEAPPLGFLYNFMVPVKLQKNTVHAGDAFLRAYNDRAGDEGRKEFWPKAPDADLNIPGVGTIKLTSSEYSKLTKLSGEKLSEMIVRREWNILEPSEAEMKIFRKMLVAARSQARGIMREEVWTRYQSETKDNIGQD